MAIAGRALDTVQISIFGFNIDVCCGVVDRQEMALFVHISDVAGWIVVQDSNDGFVRLLPLGYIKP